MFKNAKAVSLLSYSIFESKEFGKKLAKFPLPEQQFLEKKLQSYVYPQLKQEPFFGMNIRKLKGYTPETWRYRIGKYRVFYSIDTREHIVYLLTIDLRKDAY